MPHDQVTINVETASVRDRVPKSIVGFFNLSKKTRRYLFIGFIVFCALAYTGYFAYAIHYDFENDPALLIITVLFVALMLYKVYRYYYGVGSDKWVEDRTSGKNFRKFSRYSGRYVF